MAENVDKSVQEPGIGFVPSPPTPSPTPGRIVYYLLDDSGHIAPAIIRRATPGGVPGTVDLVTFDADRLTWRAAVPYGVLAAGCWTWPAFFAALGLPDPQDAEQALGVVARVLGLLRGLLGALRGR